MAQSAGDMPSWTQILQKYRHDPLVKQLVFVQYKDGADARIQLYAKTKKYPDAWTILLTCDGYVGSNGIDKEKEGDLKTPTGDYGVTSAFGIKDNPGTSIDYLKVDEHHWCAGDPIYYNKIVDDRKIAGEFETDNAEHLIDYSPQYNYALFIDYNKNGIVGKGSAIFFHCVGGAPYTGGCIAVSEENMKQILQTIDKNARICIYPLVH